MGQRWCHRPASISNLKFVFQIYFGKKPIKLPRRKFLHLAAGAAALPGVSRIARAQAYPSRPITMIAPVAPGSSGDVIARLIAERMKCALGQPIIIENISGADGSIGVGRL